MRAVVLPEFTVVNSAWKGGKGGGREPLGAVFLCPLVSQLPICLQGRGRQGVAALTGQVQSGAGRVVLVAPEPHGLIPSSQRLFALLLTELHPSRPLCMPFSQHPNPCGPLPSLTPPKFICLPCQAR